MYRWPTHVISNTPTDYSVNWRAYLGGATISTVTWFVKVGGEYVVYNNDTTVDGLTKLNQTNTDIVSTVYFLGGERNKDYFFRCKITASGVPDKTIDIKMRAQ